MKTPKLQRAGTSKQLPVIMTVQKVNENHLKYVVPLCYVAAKAASVKVLEETYYKEMNTQIGLKLI